MKIAIVNDMFMAVEAMRRVIAASGSHRVAWIAHDGAEAVRHCAKELPDLILMDLIMPTMDGVEATRQIMARTPCPIVIVTANIDTTASKVFEAMGAGALDAVNTPLLNHPTNSEGSIALLAKIETIRKLTGPKPTQKSTTKFLAKPGAVKLQYEKLLLIGASAGGPAALAKILSTLPASYPAGIVIVQHVDAQFVDGLVQWLQSQTRLRVRVASEGDLVQPGTVLVAGRDQHLVFTSTGRLGYTRLPADGAYRPSIDVLFKSAERYWPGVAVGLLLTGMGRDGADGLKRLRDRGFLTIAQDEQSSAVYGMPKAAAETNAAVEILALEQIAIRLTNVFSQTIKRS